ncbi:MAG: diguanylate cyclase [Chloroflexi bacterium]|nr:diguanylate cyclase [Chloroflexota bacterium]
MINSSKTRKTFTLLIIVSLTLTGLFLLWKFIPWGNTTGILFFFTGLFIGIVIFAAIQYFLIRPSPARVGGNKLASHLDELVYSTILETSSDSFAVVDLTGRLIFCSPQTASLHGYDSPGELIGKRAFTLLPLKEILRATKYMQLTLQSGMIKNIEFTLLKKNGDPFIAEVSASLIKNRSGASIAFMVTVRDITERKWVEEQIRESEARYRIVADNTFDWEFWQAPNDRFIYISPSCKRITGWDATEFIKNPGLVERIIHPDDRQHYLLHSVATKQNKTPGEIEFRIQRADGVERWINHICQPVFDESGNFTGTRGSNRDITERKIAEDNLQQANEQLRLQLSEIEQLQIILRQQALHDPLTGLHNRRYMEEGLRMELARAAREDYQVTIALLDMDNLKVFNDTHGHAVGDKALVLLGEKLRELTRTDDIICRYGGDEFLIVLHKTNLKDGFKRVNQWRKAMEDLRIPHEQLQLQITFTAGIATYPFHGRSLEQIIKAADDALYEAKKKGRNIVMAPDEPT